MIQEVEDLPEMLIDDLGRDDLVSALGTRWRAVSDAVMGGVSQATLRFDEHAGRRCLHLSGDVRLENDGGFVQMGLDLDASGGVVDAQKFTGIRLQVFGNGERYSMHLRSADVVRPWQSYRAHFEAPAQWCELKLPFRTFVPHRIETPLDLTCLRRLGLVAIGRPFFADVRLAEIAFYA